MNNAQLFRDWYHGRYFNFTHNTIKKVKIIIYRSKSFCHLKATKTKVIQLSAGTENPYSFSHVYRDGKLFLKCSPFPSSVLPIKIWLNILTCFARRLCSYKTNKLQSGNYIFWSNFLLQFPFFLNRTLCKINKMNRWYIENFLIDLKTDEAKWSSDHVSSLFDYECQSERDYQSQRIY